MNSHLTGEQLEGVLAGRPELAVTRHLQHCAVCATECAQLAQVMSGLRSQATEVAAFHRQRAVAQEQQPRRVPMLAWAAVMAMLFAGIATPVAMRQVHGAANVPAQQQAAAPDAGMSDEALLSGIQNDLDGSVPDSLKPLSAESSTKQ